VHSVFSTVGSIIFIWLTSVTFVGHRVQLVNEAKPVDDESWPKPGKEVEKSLNNWVNYREYLRGHKQSRHLHALVILYHFDENLELSMWMFCFFIGTIRYVDGTSLDVWSFWFIKAWRHSNNIIRIRDNIITNFINKRMICSCFYHSNSFSFFLITNSYL